MFHVFTIARAGSVGKNLALSNPVRTSHCAGRILAALGFMALSCGPALADLDTAKMLYAQKKYSAAYTELVPLAKKGDAEARYYVAYMYYYGQGVPKNSYAAAKWFGFSGTQGNGWAQLAYAGMCVDGLCGGRDEYNPHEALRWFEMAAKSQDPKIANLGMNGAKAMRENLRPERLSTEELLVLMLVAPAFAGTDENYSSPDLSCSPMAEYYSGVADMMYAYHMKCGF